MVELLFFVNSKKKYKVTDLNDFSVPVYAEFCGVKIQ